MDSLAYYPFKAERRVDAVYTVVMAQSGGAGLTAWLGRATAVEDRRSDSGQRTLANGTDKVTLFATAETPARK